MRDLTLLNFIIFFDNSNFYLFLFFLILLQKSPKCMKKKRIKKLNLVLKSLSGTLENNKEIKGEYYYLL